MIWFTSDLHLGHANILKHCARPFASIQEHDAVLIERWNDKVRSNDSVYVLGDFSFKNNRGTQEYLEQLHGRKILVRGNHDARQACNAAGWEHVWDPDPVRGMLLQLPDLQIELNLCHYPGLSWEGSERGIPRLHGHLHGNSTRHTAGSPTFDWGKWAGLMDVGVDCWSYAPISIDVIAGRMFS